MSWICQGALKEKKGPMRDYATREFYTKDEALQYGLSMEASGKFAYFDVYHS